jgi:hypothetical protein
MPKTTNPNLQFLDTARAFYAEAFDHKKKRDLAHSMEEWAELGEDEQSFAVAHLLYLNLQAQAAGQRLLVQVRDLLDEVAEGLTTAIEESLPPEPDEDLDAGDELPPEPGDLPPVVDAPVEPAPADGGAQ